VTAWQVLHSLIRTLGHEKKHASKIRSISMTQSEHRKGLKIDNGLECLAMGQKPFALW
jgi:hypothetical protein